MNVGRRPSPLLFALLAALALTVSGCHKDKHVIPATVPTATPSAGAGDTPTPEATDTPTPSPSPTISAGGVGASTTVTIAAGGGSVTLGSSGYSGTLTYPSNNSGGSATAAFSLNSNAPSSLPSPAPTGSPLLYFDFILTTSVTFNANFGVTSITVPASNPSGVTYVATMYDTDGGMEIGTPLTGTISGQTVTFGVPASSGNFSAIAADPYVTVISTY